MLDQLGPIFSIVLIDLVLSGDNAVVIGMAARRLSPENRRRAILFGGAGAIGLRILFTALAAVLLGVPYLQAAGGVLLLWIAYRLLRPHDEGAHVSEAGSLGEAIRTIVLADVVMSLDNILAVGGAAHGNLWLLLFGLFLSIPIILLGSEVVARLLGRFPILIYVGAFVLIQTAVSMVLEDDVVHEVYAAPWQVSWLITLVASVLIIGAGVLAQRRLRPAAPERTVVDPRPSEGVLLPDGDDAARPMPARHGDESVSVGRT